MCEFYLANNFTKHRKDTLMIKSYFQAFKLLDECPNIICEFGVDEGGSLLLWHDMFNPEKIIGYDNGGGFRPEYEGRNIEFRFMDQRDDSCIKQCASEFEYVADLMVDDCCHDAFQIHKTMRAYWSKLRLGGLFVVEDWHSNPDLMAFEEIKEEIAKEFNSYVESRPGIITFRKDGEINQTIHNDVVKMIAEKRALK